jgi:hypothetical protein
MTRTRIMQAWLAAVVTLTAVPALTMSAPPVSAEEAGPTKDAACKLISCSKGSQKCGDIQAELSDPVIGKFSVTWYCYEGGAGESGEFET